MLSAFGVGVNDGFWIILVFDLGLGLRTGCRFRVFAYCRPSFLFLANA